MLSLTFTLAVPMTKLSKFGSMYREASLSHSMFHGERYESFLRKSGSSRRCPPSREPNKHVHVGLFNPKSIYKKLETSISFSHGWLTWTLRANTFTFRIVMQVNWSSCLTSKFSAVYQLPPFAPLALSGLSLNFLPSKR